ncbi:MAG: Regulator of sigma-W protease RasP [Pelotomaculum sp. PtaB.Bin104]|nr:MAG: Regulator of sigma-W protease RasP [Pelotomaculum sp. PtaB.Bin104]
MLTLVASVFVFGLLIIFHELGHFAVAKMVGIKVHEFSLGFGPKLLGIPKGETSYNLRALPLGGFVRMAGADPNDEEKDLEDERGFNKKTVGQRAAVIFAGPLMNFLLAVLLLALVFLFQGLPVSTTGIREVVPGYPAEKAGIVAGDKIVAINGSPVETWNEVVALISERPGQQITVSVERGGVEKQFVLATVKDEQNGRGMIGIAPETGYQPAGLVPALALGLDWTARVTFMIIDYIPKMIIGQEPAELGGPVRVVSEIGKAAQIGLLFLLQLAAFLSINLGLFNLFPIPALDGSRILFLAWEKIFGRPVDPVKENYIHMIGFGLLLIFMVIVTYNDILQIFILDQQPGQQ